VHFGNDIFNLIPCRVKNTRDVAPNEQQGPSYTFLPNGQASQKEEIQQAKTHLLPLAKEIGEGGFSVLQFRFAISKARSERE
jgi:hypothetical protein